MLEGLLTEKNVKQSYLESYYTNVSDKKPINTKPNELIRASFGLDSLTSYEVSDLVKNNINAFFNGVGEKVSDIEKFLPADNRVEGSHGSTDMPTYLVKTDKNMKGYYITNNSVSTKVKVEGVEKLFRPKELTPNELLLTKSEYKSKKSLIEVAKSAIKNKVKDELHLKFLLKLIDVCGNPENYGFKSTKKSSIDDILGEYVINCELEDFEKIEEFGNLGNIQNDFGEVLGSIFIFNLIEPEGIGNGVRYPGPTERLIDFKFNEKGISSKAGEGAAATITEYINIIDKAQNKGWVMTPEQLAAKERILTPLSLGETAYERKPNKWFGKAIGSGVFVGAITLFNSFNLKGWLSFKSEFGIRDSNDLNRDDIIDAFNRLGEQGTLFKSLSNYKRNVKFDPETKNEIFLNIINAKNRKESIESWNAFLNTRDNEDDNGAAYKEVLDLLIGSLLYPCSNEVTYYIFNVEQQNKETYMQTINTIINHCVNVNQLNLKINIKRDFVKFEMHSSKTSNYKIQGLNSFGRPLMANFKLKKK